MRRICTIAALLVLAGCSDIPLSGGGGHEFAKQTGPLIVPPHMRDGYRQ